MQLPPRLVGVTLDTFAAKRLRVEPQSEFSGWMEALKSGRVVRATGEIDTCGVGLWLVGVRASDFLASIMVHAVEDLGMRGLYLPAVDYLDTMRPDGGRRFVERAEEDEILVLANLGFEASTEWTQATIRSLLLKRYEEGLPTLVSASFLPEKVLPESFAREAFVQLAIMGSA